MTITAMTNGDSSQAAEELRRKMRTIRREMGEDLEEIVGQAERLFDWRYYVRQHPWKLVGVATCLGCFVAWRFARGMSVPTKVIPHSQVTVAAQQQVPSERVKSPLLSSLMSLGGDLLLRAALTFAIERVGKMLEWHSAKYRSAAGEAASVGWPKESGPDFPGKGDPFPNQYTQRDHQAAEVCP